MTLLFILSIPALSGLITMVAAITGQTLAPRLRQRPSQVIPFPSSRLPMKLRDGSRMAG